MAPAKSKPKAKMGRPLKSPAAAAQVRGVRLTDEDCVLIERLIESEQARLEEQGAMVTRLTLGDVVRSLVRQEAHRRGLTAA